MQGSAKALYQGALTSALQYQGFCGNVTECQLVASGLSVSSNYTIIVFALRAATVQYDLSDFVCCQHRSFGGHDGSRASSQELFCHPYRRHRLLGFFAQALADSSTFQTGFLGVDEFESLASRNDPVASIADVANSTCSISARNYYYKHVAFTLFLFYDTCKIPCPAVGYDSGLPCDCTSSCSTETGEERMRHSCTKLYTFCS